jgi:Xanthomonas XOO_2897-like deaminase/Domain of unknown function DUF11
LTSPPFRDRPRSRLRPAAAGGLLALLLAAFLIALSGPPAAAQGTFDPIDLDQRLYQYRDDHKIPIGRNVAVFEFEYPDKSRGTIAIDSEQFTDPKTRGDRIQGHSERRAAQILRSYGIQPEQVKRILSERQPCMLPGAFCARMLATEFPDAEVNWKYEYGDSKESRQRGNAQMKQTLSEYEFRRNEFDKTMRVPGSKAPSGPLADALARPGARPGGIDFSSLELRYVSDKGPKGGGIGYSLAGRPTEGPSDPAAGLAAAKRSSDAFFAWLTLPPQSFWVNLKPHEANTIIDPQFARTDAGHVMLDADFRLKRILWPNTHPDTPTGAEFWRRIDALYGNDRLKANICASFRVWIEAAPATVRESAGELYILDAPLAVKMEAIAPPPGEEGRCPADDPVPPAAKVQVFQDVVAPAMSQTVNTSPEFAELRRVYLSRVAAEWVRARADRATPLGRLIDSGQIDQWAANPPWNPMDIFNQYLHAYRNPDFSYTRTFEQGGQTYTFTYVMGGVDFSRTPRENVSKQDFRARWPGRAKEAKKSLQAPSTGADGQVWLGAGERTDVQPRIRNVAGFRRAARATQLSMTASRRRVASGARVEFALRLRNRSGARISRADVCDRLPRELVYVSSRGAGRHAVRDGEHCWRLAGIAAGRTARIGVTARVAGGARGSLRNEATVTVANAPALGARATQTVRVAGTGTAPAGGVTG